MPATGVCHQSRLIFVMTPDYSRFDLAGSHYALGLAQGRATEPFVVPAWWPEPPPLAFALECAAEVAAVHAPLLDELQGYAEAQGLAYADLLRGVCRRSMRLRAASFPSARLLSPAHLPAAFPRFGTPNTWPEGGCSSFAVVGQDGHVRVGRNYDFHPVQRVRQCLRTTPAVGRASVGTRGSVPGGRYDGVNDAGLFVALHVALSDEPAEARPGLPFHLLPRLVLETCASTPEAVDLLLRVRHLHAFSYLLADAAGRLAVVEAHPEVVRMAASGGAFVAATNHYRHPELAARQRRRKLTHSQQRLAALEAFAPVVASGAVPLPRALADHAGRVCGHAGGHTTLWSVEADLTARTITYAPGPPCVTAFEPVRWPGAACRHVGEEAC